MVWYPGKRLVEGAKNVGHNIMERRRARQGLRERANAPLGPAPQFGGAMDQYGADRAAQGQALGLLGAAAQGEAPSAAQAQLQQSVQQNVANQMGMLGASGGRTLASAGRAAAGMGAAGAMAEGQQLAALRAEEEAAARAAYAQQANQMAGMSAGLMGQNLGLQAQYGLGGRQMDIQQLQNQRQFGLGLADRAIGAGQGIMQGAAFFSDENLKTEIKDAEDEALDAFRGLAAVSYRYRSPRHGPARRRTTGFTAQDLERSRAGRQVVRNTPEGKAIDIAGASSLTMAGLAALTRKVEDLERRNG